MPELGDRSGDVTGLSPALGEFQPGFQSVGMVWAKDAELVVKQFPECSRGTAGVCREVRTLVHAADPEVTETVKRSTRRSCP